MDIKTNASGRFPLGGDLKIKRLGFGAMRLPASFGFVPFFPLGGGLSPLAASGLDRVAARRGATRPQVALARLLARSPVMPPIPGTGSLAHLEENMGAADLRLTDEDLADLRA